MWPTETAACQCFHAMWPLVLPGLANAACSGRARSRRAHCETRMLLTYSSPALGLSLATLRVERSIPLPTQTGHRSHELCTNRSLMLVSHHTARKRQGSRLHDTDISAAHAACGDDRAALELLRQHPRPVAVPSCCFVALPLSLWSYACCATLPLTLRMCTFLPALPLVL